jgi:hypothetical protein
MTKAANGTWSVTMARSFWGPPYYSLVIDGVEVNDRETSSAATT